MKITHNGARFELTFRNGPDFYADLAAAKGAGFTWERDTRTWWTTDAAVVGRLRGTGATATPEVMALIAAESDRAAQAILQSRATDSDIDIPVPDGLSYLAYQKAGIAYALRIFGDLK